LPWSILPEQPNPRLMMEDIPTGIDELGVLLMGHVRTRTPPFDRPRQGADAATCDQPASHSSVQVGIVSVMENPDSGILEMDQLEHAPVPQVTESYLRDIVEIYSDWTPLQDRDRIFPRGHRSVMFPGNSAISGSCNYLLSMRCRTDPFDRQT
jgi:homospermidine synthase